VPEDGKRGTTMKTESGDGARKRQCQPYWRGKAKEKSEDGKAAFKGKGGEERGSKNSLSNAASGSAHRHWGHEKRGQISLDFRRRSR